MNQSRSSLDEAIEQLLNVDPSLGGGGVESADCHIHNHVITHLTNAKELEAASFHFAALETPRARSQFFVDVVEVVLLQNPVPQRFCAKDDRMSSALREAAHRSIRQRHLGKAYKYYMQALCMATMGGVDMALAYANLAEVFVESGLYREALKVIDLTLTCAYPVHYMSRLATRKLTAELMLSSSNDNTNNNISNNSSLAAAHRSVLAMRRYHHAPIPPVPPNRINSSLPHAFDSIKLMYTPTKGQHIAAKRDILPGELLLAEPAFLTSPIAHSESVLHCDYCTQFSYILIPCPNCCYAVYCGEACRQRAYRAYHFYECPVLGKMYYHGMSRFHALVLRLVIMGRDEMTTFPDFFSVIDNLDNTLYAGGFMQTCRLIIKRATAREPIINNETKLLNSITSAAIYCLLKDSTPFFLTYPTIGETVLELAYLALQADEFASFDIYKEDSARGRVRFAHAHFPSASIFRPSCCAPVITSMRGNVLLVHAARRIVAGEEIHLNYISYLDRGQYFRRQYVLYMFGHECDCVACQNNWPMWPQMQRVPNALTKLEGVAQLVRDVVLDKRSDSARVLEPILMNILKTENPPEPGFFNTVMLRLLGVCFTLQGNIHVSLL